MRRLLAAVLAAVLLIGGYAALDAYDLVPGILTRDRAPAPSAAPVPAETVAGPVVTVPTPAATAAPLPAATVSAPLPARAVLRRQLADELAAPGLGRRGARN